MRKSRPLLRRGRRDSCRLAFEKKVGNGIAEAFEGAFAKALINKGELSLEA